MRLEIKKRGFDSDEIQYRNGLRLVNEIVICVLIRCFVVEMNGVSEQRW